MEDVILHVLMLWLVESGFHLAEHYGLDEWVLLGIVILVLVLIYRRRRR